mmetsp:Transcript_28400/g.98074  ORF Transcript_28400/g.98074 Transcript_28400/m.98074 type:complete len:231 (+) Transcript_28400:237-929(+)
MAAARAAATRFASSPRQRHAASREPRAATICAGRSPRLRRECATRRARAQRPSSLRSPSASSQTQSSSALPPQETPSCRRHRRRHCHPRRSLLLAGHRRQLHCLPRRHYAPRARIQLTSPGTSTAQIPPAPPRERQQRHAELGHWARAAAAYPHWAASDRRGACQRQQHRQNQRQRRHHPSSTQSGSQAAPAAAKKRAATSPTCADRVALMRGAAAGCAARAGSPGRRRR